MRWRAMGILRATLVASGLAVGVLAARPCFAQSAARANTTGTATVVDATVDVDAWLAKLTGTDGAARKGAVLSLDAAAPAMLPSIAKHLAELKKTANRDAMADMIARLRKGATGDDEKKAPGVVGQPPDLFERVMASPAPGDGGWRDVAAVASLSRMLARIGTTPAVRELAGVYPGFGELFRIDVEREMRALGERSVATLIELRRGDAKPLRPWAAKILDALGKTVPGEAVQTADNQVLADVLRAYGRTKDTDAARVIVSFANSDRAQVRDAAREAVAMLGENGIWQLRESYENLVGKKPPEEWNWEKLSVELFAAYDRARLSEVYALMDEGLEAYKAGKLDAMASAFDRVLARAPAFDKRREMVPGYMDFARSIEKTDSVRACAVLRKVVRLDPNGPRAKEAESELSLLEATDLANRGLVDESAYRRAVDLDPNNARAKEALARIQSRSSAGPIGWTTYLIASALALAAMACAAVALFWRRRPA